MWVPESCYLVSCLGPSYGSAQRFVLLKKTEIEVLCCGCMDYPSKDWACLPRDYCLIFERFSVGVCFWQGSYSFG